MIRINLLPVRQTRRIDATKREIVLAGIGLAGVLAICGVAYVVQAARAADLTAENSQLQKDIDNLKAVVARVDEVDKLKSELTEKLTVIRRLKANKAGPVRMLDELSNATPEKLTVDLLSEKNSKVKLTGVAVSNEVISQFLSNLERSDWFTDVYLVGIDQTVVDDYKLKQFEVTTRVVIPNSEPDPSTDTQASGKAGKKGRKGKTQ